MGSAGQMMMKGGIGKTTAGRTDAYEALSRATFLVAWAASEACSARAPSRHYSGLARAQHAGYD